MLPGSPVAAPDSPRVLRLREVVPAQAAYLRPEAHRRPIEGWRRTTNLLRPPPPQAPDTRAIPPGYARWWLPAPGQATARRPWRAGNSLRVSSRQDRRWLTERCGS